MTDREKLDAIERIARRHCTPSVNVGAHQLAADILEVIDEKPSDPMQNILRTEPVQLPSATPGQGVVEHDPQEPPDWSYEH